jgi:hypothetical protein
MVTETVSQDAAHHVGGLYKFLNIEIVILILLRLENQKMPDQKELWTLENQRRSRMLGLRYSCVERIQGKSSVLQ